LYIESGKNMEIMIRPSAVILENDRILLIKQNVTETRNWSLPGGALEADESIEQCLLRELKEETGLDVSVIGLLYLTDRFYKDTHIVHMTFLVERAVDTPLELTWNHIDDCSSSTTGRLREIRMVPIDELTEYGFASTFINLVKANFPERGYKGNFEKLYGKL
jgi:ADP-ribose pyrophosphatase YjhB (NUDIX family)